MTFTTASGLLPAEIAVYVQREPNGVHLETRYPVGLQGFTSQSETRGPNRERASWEDGSQGSVYHEQSTYGLSSRSAVIPYIKDERAPTPGSLVGTSLA